AAGRDELTVRWPLEHESTGEPAPPAAADHRPPCRRRYLRHRSSSRTGCAAPSCRYSIAAFRAKHIAMPRCEVVSEGSSGEVPNEQSWMLHPYGGGWSRVIPTSAAWGLCGRGCCRSALG